MMRPFVKFFAGFVTGYAISSMVNGYRSLVRWEASK